MLCPFCCHTAFRCVECLSGAELEILYEVVGRKVSPDGFGLIRSETQVQEFGVSFFVLSILVILFFADSFRKMLDYVMFLTKRCIEEKIRMPADHNRLILHTTPASHLNQLSSLVEWGGDALADAERLYDDF